jgi:glycosyltransferase involved in cell wall biosynthesis
MNVTCRWRLSAERLIIVAKSPWSPAIRREHELALLAAGAGAEVTFLERPRDVRHLAADVRRWTAGLRGVRSPDATDAVDVVQASTLVPGHRGRGWEWIEASIQRRILRRLADGPPATIVATQPWQWPALRGLPCRRVLDVADDWSGLIPRRAARMRALCARAAGEADAVIVVSEPLRTLFPGAEVRLIPNGVDERLLAEPPRPVPGARRLVYVGTLSERFDAPLVGALIEELPDWTLDLYGPCSYAGQGADPGDELRDLLDRTDGRVRWHGVVDRDRVGDVLDRADVLLIAHRARHSRGQDSMKLYDYAARGRPIVATSASLVGISETPPHLLIGGDAPELARLVLRGGADADRRASEQARWAGTRSWSSRWPQWSSAVFGTVGSADRAPLRATAAVSSPSLGA